MSEKVGDEKFAADANYPSGQVGRHPPPSQRKVHDTDVTFEEYDFYAKRTREEQRTKEAPVLIWRTAIQRLRRRESDHSTEHRDEKPAAPTGLVITEDEWTNASRAFRTASWGAVFYLVSMFLGVDLSLLTI